MNIAFAHDTLETLKLQSPESPVQTHIRVRIPKSSHQQPVISNLVNQYGLEVNILGALLGVNGQEDGWFDLELRGQAQRIHAALIDLMALGADLWFDQEVVDPF